MSGDKPKYKVPSMKEIEQIPWNGYNVVSTFSGGGGSGWSSGGGKSTAKGRRAQYKASARRMNTVRTNVAFSRGEDLPF